MPEPEKSAPSNLQLLARDALEKALKTYDNLDRVADAVLLVVTQYVEQHEKEKALSRSDHPSVISDPDQRGDGRGDL